MITARNSSVFLPLQRLPTKVKAKSTCKGKIQFTLKQAKGGLEVQLYFFFNLGARWRWVVKPTNRPLCPQERKLVSTVQEAGWASGIV
jgi:hypothetical protein